MAKVLITGASGFIGYHLAAALVERGDQVVGMVRSRSNVEGLQDLDVELAVADVIQPDSLEGVFRSIEVVYHLAGLTKASSHAAFRRVNEQGAAHVAAACAASDAAPTLVNVSSLAAAGPAIQGRARQEADPPAPVSHYGRSKLAGESALARFAGQLPITTVRPPIVFGERDAGFLAIVRPICRSGIHVIPGLPRKDFSLIHAEDLVRVLVAAAESGERLQPPGNDPSRGIYYAECERRVSYGELGSLVAESMGRRCLRLPLPHPLVWCTGAVAQTVSGLLFGKTPRLNIDKAREATAGSWLCDASKAKSQLKFEVAKPLPQRIRQTVHWYQQQGWL